MLRRSFLALLGLGAGAATKSVAAVEPIAPAMPIVPPVAEVPSVPVTVPDFPVRMPVRVSLTKEQIEFCEAIGMNPVQYAKNLIELDKAGKLETTTVNMQLEAELEQLEAKA